MVDSFNVSGLILGGRGVGLASYSEKYGHCMSIMSASWLW
jgi:hypothetical protein